MVVTLLLMLIGGIAFSQVVSNPAQVTLRWLRLGGLIMVSLVAACYVSLLLSTEPLGQYAWLTLVALAAGGQLMLTQLGKARPQRVAALLVFLWCVVAVIFRLGADLTQSVIAFNQTVDPDFRTSISPFTWTGLSVTAALSTALGGGAMMTMLLGHAYLTAGGEMTQQPFLRLTRAVAVVILLRLIASITFGLVPWYLHHGARVDPMWSTVMVSARLAVGLIAPAVFIYMIHDCVKRRANQSATGILYVMLVLIVIGEGVALALMDSTRLVF